MFIEVNPLGVLDDVYDLQDCINKVAEIGQ